MPGASLNVPHFNQEFHYSCIPACARMVLAFFGQQHTEAELRTLMKTGPSGTPVRRLTELTHLGFDVDFPMTDLAGLSAYLTSGVPPIALLCTAALPYWSQSCDHVAVVVGVDDSWVYLNDPYFDSAPQQVSHSDFLLAWSPNACTVAIVRPRPCP
jgi:ABC-type bacteriocin/lantibiotic exporter with double-glycine peptidase domain